MQSKGFLSKFSIGGKITFCLMEVIAIVLIVGTMIIFFANESLKTIDLTTNKIIPQNLMLQELKFNVLENMKFRFTYLQSQSDADIRKADEFSTKNEKNMSELDLLIQDQDKSNYQRVKDYIKDYDERFQYIFDLAIEIRNYKTDLDNMKNQFVNNFLSYRNSLVKINNKYSTENQRRIKVLSDVVRGLEIAANEVSDPEIAKKRGAEINGMLSDIKNWAPSGLYNTNYQIFKNIIAKNITYNEKQNEYIYKNAEIIQTSEKINDTIDLLIESVHKNSSDHINIISENLIYIIKFFIIVMIVIALISFITGQVINKKITSTAKRTLANLDSIANGDLTQEPIVDSNDEFGKMNESMINMLAKLREIINKFKEGANTISTSSEEIARTSQEMSSGAGTQASSAEEVSSSIEEMSAGICLNSDNAKATEKIALKTLMNIKKSSEASQQSMLAMKDIANKISIIDEIAFQTNILALNASVEAARAGDQGRGFAVVAAEVRKLAERSATAAAEIDKVSKQGVILSENTENLLKDIIPDIEKTADLVREIAASSSEQSSGIGQINNAVQQLNEITQRYAASAEELAATSQQLAAKSIELKNTTNFFKIEKNEKLVNQTKFSKPTSPVKNTTTSRSTNNSTKFEHKKDVEKTSEPTKKFDTKKNNEPAKVTPKTFVAKPHVNKGTFIDMKDNSKDSDYEKF
jgi:methyl-accepting chemotaxis protein